MNSDQFFFDDTDEEKVNSLVFGFYKEVATLLQASTSTTPKIPRNPIARDRHGTHDSSSGGLLRWTTIEALTVRNGLGLHAQLDFAVNSVGLIPNRSNNDINVIRQSPLLDDLEVEKATEVPFVANDVNYIRGIIMEYLVKISKKASILELKRRHLKIIVLTSYTPYPSRKIRRICACTSKKTTKE
ncbi:retrovirus-related pol polyprotein from transposon TNT 1-94 [Tanacetum coccineum]